MAKKLLKYGDRVVKFGNRIAYVEEQGSLIIPLTVKGTHFPASVNRASLHANFTLRNKAGVDGEVFIDFQDGTGKHAYQFNHQNELREISFERVRDINIDGETTPENISDTGWNAEDVYFYQDLPLPAGTVDDYYDHERTILIEFQRYYELDTLLFNNVSLFGVIPSEIGRFSNLRSLIFRYVVNMTGIAADFEKFPAVNNTFANLGFSFGNVVPQSALDSNRAEMFNFSSTFNFSGQTAEQARLDDFFTNPAYLPNMETIRFSNCSIETQIPNMRKDMTATFDISQNNNIPAFSPDLSTWKWETFEADNVYIPHSEMKRLLENGEVINYNAARTKINVDFTLDNENTTLKSIDIGRLDGQNGHYGNTIPSFLVSCVALEELQFNNNNSSVSNNQVTSWGVGLPPSLRIFRAANMPNMTPTLPAWFSALNLEIFQSDCWQTTTRIDAHVSSFYAIAANFPSLDFNLNHQGISARPSGTYQDSGGNPTSPMEMIWEMVNVHNMVVTVRNEAGNGKDIYTP